MFSNKESFKENFKKRVEMLCGKSFSESTSRDHYETLGLMIREYVSNDWIKTNEKYLAVKGKQVFYLSIEYLLGKLLRQNLINLGVEGLVEKGLEELGIVLEELEEIEPDAGLGNGGLGRLAACFLDSLASLNLPGHGHGIRYKHGLFEQKIVNGYQVELPEQWLRSGNVWEIRKADLAVQIPFWGKVEAKMENGRLVFHHLHTETVTAVPYDVPVVGYHCKTVNTLRLWNAEPAQFPINKDILQYKRRTEAISEFLYPDDTHDEGKILRLKQQYFLVSASLQSIIRSYKKQHGSLNELHQQICIHINDTHPVLAIPELMRILIDEEGFGWDEAWHITKNTISYTNHTTLSEALEKWPIHIFQPLLPRIYMIVNEINERFCRELWEETPGDWDRIAKLSIIADGYVKMAHLAIVGSFSVNGVARLHTEILKEREMQPFYQLFPDKFNNKTNGIAHRRWLLKANPKLSTLISERIGNSWTSAPHELINLLKYQEDRSLLKELGKIKRANKEMLADIIYKQNGITVDPQAIFDVQVKRLHAYKRQLLNVLHILHLYNRILEDSSFRMIPRVFIFGAKASPGYYYAKKIIKLINTVADKVNNDPRVGDQMKVIFLENYRVSLAEKIFTAADVSEQISTASKEASGTGNMKFMINGALTIGTLDGANIEIHERVGDENIFIFGLTAEEVLHYYRHGGYDSDEYYHHDSRIQQIVDQLVNGFFPDVHNEFEPIFDSLLEENDQYFVLKDFASYAETQRKIGEAFKDQISWQKKCLVNIAHAGYFSSDRTIREYAKDIWDIHPVT
ncbi:glycogen/starch/alpha-glucan phosphorylase [Neobacillus thermocopriae]|uniref:Alpha-1,4 glucan phosphorylase n=1 Tax=Neobacillus thermocopriae TaxID=1215031 RepID=A0A6B3TQL0_9BACI|nr:glycogen/starch/alpha-glucan phosphorylase [Neobacillus thermocopriae]MED3623304.1 glycogen/starch/alpha-glucan phosphorylase [Neobacillus thermocopriae]MED3715181.1 glycogen/starch/alpha-glucan phosphorylase [Neobacillus thermocopriae]NEX78686.1 glycogen/starch/alpha-glucan phosphorylase [Neobacillus thermocopriae]